MVDENRDHVAVDLDVIVGDNHLVAGKDLTRNVALAVFVRERDHRHACVPAWKVVEEQPLLSRGRSLLLGEEALELQDHQGRVEVVRLTQFVRAAVFDPGEPDELLPLVEALFVVGVVAVPLVAGGVEFFSVVRLDLVDEVSDRSILNLGHWDRVALFVDVVIAGEPLAAPVGLLAEGD